MPSQTRNHVKMPLIEHASNARQTIKINIETPILKGVLTNRPKHFSRPPRTYDDTCAETEPWIGQFFSSVYLAYWFGRRSPTDRYGSHADCVCVKRRLNQHSTDPMNVENNFFWYLAKPSLWYCRERKQTNMGSEFSRAENGVCTIFHHKFKVLYNVSFADISNL